MMKPNHIALPLLFSLPAFLLSTNACASTPLLTYTPQTKTTVTVPANSTRTIKYLMVNTSNEGHVFILNTLPTGITQITSGTNVCKSPFSLKGTKSCMLTLTIDGATLAGNVSLLLKACQQKSDGTPSAFLCYEASQRLNITKGPDAEATLALDPDISFLALSVNNLTLNAALTGQARTITIVNNDLSDDAENVTFTVTPSLPAGTTIFSDQNPNTSCGTIAHGGGACVLTITPGSTPVHNQVRYLKQVPLKLKERTPIS